MITIDAARQHSDPEVLSVTARLAAEGRHLTADLVALLAVLVERKLYAGEGYGTAHDFCVGRLLLSDGQAYHRLSAAQVAGRFPRVLDGLRDGRLTMTNLALLRPHLTDENAERLLTWAEGRRKIDVERFVRGLAPLPDVAPSLRRLPAPGPRSSPESVNNKTRSLSACDILSSADDKPSALSPRDNLSSPDNAACTARMICESDASESTTSHTVGALAGPPPAPLASRPLNRTELRPLTPSRYSLRVTISEETHGKLRRAHDLLGHTAPGGDLDVVLNRALTVLIEQLEKAKYAATKRTLPRRPAPRSTPTSSVPGGGPPASIALGEVSLPEPTFLHRQSRASASAANRAMPAASATSADAGALPSATSSPGYRGPFALGAERRPTSAASRTGAAVANEAASPTASTLRSRATVHDGTTNGSRPAQRSRYIPAAVRRAVYARDEGQCSFVSRDGHRCGQTRRLEFHHRVPFAEGGPATVDNLCLACRVHNGWEAVRWFGEAALRGGGKGSAAGGHNDVDQSKSFERQSTGRKPRADR